MPIIRGHHSFEDHFTQIPNSWLRDSRLTFKARGLLALIMSHRSGWSISVNSLAEANQEGRDAIRAAVNELVALGYLKREQVNDGRFGEAVWTTQDPTENPMTENPTTENPTTKKNILKEEQDTRTIYAQDELERESVKESKHAVKEAFDMFWTVYPRKVGRGAAFKAYAKAVQVDTIANILDGTKRLASDPNLPPTQFIPYPATWLNREGWNDDPYPVREVPAEERKALELAELRRKQSVEREATKALLAEMREQERKATPPPKCVHGNSIVSCRECLRRKLD